MKKLPTKEDLFRWVDDRLELDCPREVLLLNKLAAWTGAGWEFWVPVKTLMQQTRSSERKVHLMLRKFEALGFIRKTGATHRLEDSTRSVPIYIFAGFVDHIRAESMPAPRAVMQAHPCTDEGGITAQGVQVHRTKEQTPSDEGDARAQEREALFEKIEAGVHRSCLGNTDRGAALIELARVLEAGFAPEGLVAAAAAWGADRTAKRRDTGLQFWLRDRKFRAWWPEAPAAAQAAETGPPAFDPPRDVADILFGMGAAWVASWLRDATWSDGVIRCRNGFSADTVRNAVGRKLDAIGWRVEAAARKLEGVGDA